MAYSYEKLVSWRLRLLEGQFNIVHRPVVMDQATYVLSRLETTGADKYPLEDDIQVLEVPRAVLS